MRISDWSSDVCSSDLTLGKTPAQMMQAEARRIEAAVAPNALRIALDEHGKDITTMALSHELEKWRGGGQDIAFLIGGPDGLDADLKRSCQGLLRLDRKSTRLNSSH